MGLGKTNKTKGSDAERFYANKFKELGFEHCITSRLGSKRHDNAKIDLIYIPFNVQVKAGVQKNMNPGKELTMMKDSIEKMFPKEDSVHTNPCILIHKKLTPQRSFTKRTPEMEIVYMSYKQYEEYVEKGADLALLSIKEFKFETVSEFKSVVGITFQCFIENIVKPFYIK